MKAVLDNWVSDSIKSKPGSLFAQFITHLRTPLYRNGYALIISAAASSGLGFVFWILAARYYSVETVGINSAALSALLFLSGISQLGLNSVLVRFLPLAGHATRRMVVYSYLVSLLAAALISAAFILGLQSWSPVLKTFLNSPFWAVSFILAAMIYCIFALQDSVLTGLRQSVWIPLENILFSIIKILLLLAFAGSFQHFGIITAYTIPIAISLLPINAMIFRWFIPRHTQRAASLAKPVFPRQITRFILGNYLGALFFLASTTILPLIVIELAGAETNAYFFLPWTIASSLQLVSVNMANSLTVEAVQNRDDQNIYYWGVLLHTLRLITPAVMVILLGAPYVLLLFGRGYSAEGTSLLRLLCLSTIPNALVWIYISLARVENKVLGIAVVQGTLCLLGLSMSYYFLQAFGLTGVGIAWLTVQTFVAMVLLLTKLRPVMRAGIASLKREQS